MKLTIDSIAVVHITVHKMVLCLRGKQSEPTELIWHLFFVALNGYPTVCACMRVCERTGACSDIRKSTKGGMARCLLALSDSEDRAVACGAGAGYSSAVFGLYPLDTVQKHSTEQILQATTWQGGVLEVLLSAEQKLEVPCRRQPGCNAGMSQVKVLISNIVGNCQRKRL